MSCRTITLRKDKFDEREDDFYEALYTQSQAQFATYVQTGTVVNNYAHIFDLLIRLRQVSMPAFKQERRRLWVICKMYKITRRFTLPWLAAVACGSSRSIAAVEWHRHGVRLMQ